MAARSDGASDLAEARAVSKTFVRDEHQLAVLRDVSLTVRPSEVIAILGPSGCGKSTLLRILIGLIPPTAGSVKEHGNPLTGIHPGAAVVFQNFALFPWLTVQENVRVALNRAPISEEESRSRVAHAIEQE